MVTKKTAERTVRVELTLDESGILCHVLMQKMLESGGLKNVEKQPAVVLRLYEKLTKANDRLRP